MITSAEEFIRLRNSQIPSEYYRSARDESTIDVWMEIITKHPEYKKWVIINKTVPIEVLNYLITDSDPLIRSLIAEKRKLTREMQLVLANDIDVDVRRRLLYNKKLYPEILKRLKLENLESSLPQNAK